MHRRVDAKEVQVGEAVDGREHFGVKRRKGASNLAEAGVDGGKQEAKYRLPRIAM